MPTNDRGAFLDHRLVRLRLKPIRRPYLNRPLRQPLKRLNMKSLITQATSLQEAHLWHLTVVDRMLRPIVESTNRAEVTQDWAVPTGARLALDTERSRLVSISFANQDCRKRLEESIGFTLPDNAPRISDETVIMRLPGNEVEHPTLSFIAPGTFLASASQPVLIPETVALEWLCDPLSMDRIAVCPPSILRLTNRRDWTKDRYLRIA